MTTTEQEPTEPKKADKDGVYTLPDGTPVHIKEGDEVPEGAEYRGDASWTQDADPYGATDKERTPAGEGDQRAKGPAPENRGRPGAPPVPPEKKDQG